MAGQKLPDGLRYVLIYVIAENEIFPPPPDSIQDIALLRAANLALQRKIAGHEDHFIFVCTAGGIEAADFETASSKYGFPNAHALIFNPWQPDLVPGEMVEPLADGEFNELAGIQIEGWIQENHPGAISFPGAEYDTTSFWWVGIEHEQEVFEWPFDVDAFATSLPDVHRRRAETWLTVLGHAVDLPELQATVPDILGYDQAKAWAATLCQWLHGFQAASGYDYNHFSCECSAELLPSGFFLGFELARVSGDDLNSLCDDHECDIHDLGMAAMQAITGEWRSELRTGLSLFFGGECPLFWSLYSAIWPVFDRPMSDAIYEKFSSDCHDDLAELDAPWQFVSTGWCDQADE